MDTPAEMFAAARISAASLALLSNLYLYAMSSACAVV